GDGAGEHPSQALLDLFTIHEAFGRIKGLHIGLCGDLKNSRTVHSLLRVLMTFGCNVSAVSPAELALPESFIREAKAYGGNLRAETDLGHVLPELDVLYMTRVQRERFSDLSLYERVRKHYALTRSDLESASPNLKILHPLPRVDEMEVEIDQDARAHYFIQAANGVPVRMALLSKVLGLDQKT
ncbi:aspartate carbamoyltransferase, partial [bacterium]